MSKSILLAATALATIAAASAAYAQDTGAAAPTEVQSIQVTARNLEDTLPEQLAQTGVKVEVISGQAVRNGGYQDVETALQIDVEALVQLLGDVHEVVLDQRDLAEVRRAGVQVASEEAAERVAREVRCAVALKEDVTGPELRDLVVDVEVVVVDR